MSDTVVAAIINGTITSNMTVPVTTTTVDGNGNASGGDVTATVNVKRFNVQEMSYGDAVQGANSSKVDGFMEMMLGEVVGMVGMGGVLSEGVEARGSRMFRLRALEGVGGRRRDEL